MKTFLDKTAEYILSNFKEDIDQVCVVLPNRRAGLFFKRSLSRITDKAIWSPGIYSIEDFILSLSGYRIIDPVFLQFELYKVYKDSAQDNVQSFEEFIKWGRMLLNDFNEVDMYMADTGQLFGYLTDEKALSLWNLDKKPLTEFQIRYLHFYKSLKTLYDRLNDELIRRNEVYQGLAYRKVAQDINGIMERIVWKKIIFAGFNALTQSEQQIISSLENSGKAIILWDADHYYIHDESQESGKFIRPVFTRSDKNQFKWLEDNYRESEKTITIIGVPQSIGQAKVTGRLLKELTERQGELEHTAVVLNDEKILEPLLNSIPVEVGNFNLTMGLPLKNTPMFRLFDSIFELQINIQKFKKSGVKSPKIYFRDLLRVLDHPYFSSLLDKNNSIRVASGIRKSNKVFIDYEELVSTYFINPGSINKSIAFVFKPWEDNPAIGLEGLLGLTDELKALFIQTNKDDESYKKDQSLDLEYLFHFSKAIRKLSDLAGEFPFIQNLKVLRSLFMQVAQGSIPFYGEPLHGLQVMGMLETQTLDFRNIILLSANEDFIPSGKSLNSFIPFDIRRKFGLPTYPDKNAVYAYHFYRLIQRAERISILYSTEPGELGGGDKSRFVSQLQYELPKFNKNIIIHEKILSVPLSNIKRDDKIEIKKTPELIERLNELSIRGFSASALNTFRRCSLQYYFKYLAGLDQADEPEETIEASTLGSVVHDVLASLFIPFEGKNLLPDDVMIMKTQVETLVAEAFGRIYEGGDMGFGKNLLVAKVAVQYVNNFLDAESNFLKNNEYGEVNLTIRKIEKEFSTPITIESNSWKLLVKLSGRFDRVDECDGIIRIIDYKTGRIEPNDLKMKLWDDLAKESKLDKCFQLLFYTYVYSNMLSTNPKIILPGIISIRNLSNGLMKLTLPDSEMLSVDTLLKFDSILKLLLSELFDPEIAFQQTEILENCRYCIFASVCNRI
jgi:hypothetical protein